MANGTKALCPECTEEIIPGTLYCWRHGTGSKVGDFLCDEGHLVWATRDARGKAERCVAVLVENRQVLVHDVEVDDKSAPVKLSLHYVDIGSSNEANADIVLSELVNRMIDGWESVHATHRSA